MSVSETYVIKNLLQKTFLYSKTHILACKTLVAPILGNSNSQLFSIQKTCNTFKTFSAKKLIVYS